MNFAGYLITRRYSNILHKDAVFVISMLNVVLSKYSKILSRIVQCDIFCVKNGIYQISYGITSTTRNNAISLLLLLIIIKNNNTKNKYNNIININKKVMRIEKINT